MSVTQPIVAPYAINQATEHDRCTVQHWGFFSRGDIEENRGKLLMLDIDFGRDCSLRCPSCFRKRNNVDDSGDPDLTYEEILDVIAQGRELGLRAVKICGAGEPLENPDLLRFARQLTEWEIGLSIFTKGHVLGDDCLAASIFGHEGIRSAKALAHALYELRTSVLISFQSFRTDVQDRLVGEVKGHTNRRNKAVENCAEIGFNKHMPTRMALCANPITKENYEELFDIYKYCRERNILPVNAALMVSGKQINSRFLENTDVDLSAKIGLYAKIYCFNLRTGIQSWQTIKNDGISPMAGIHPCNQIACGLYVTSNGNVVNCPGNCSNIEGNTRNESLVAIWKRSLNFTRTGRYNCQCPPKVDTTLPSCIYDEVMIAIQRDRLCPGLLI